MMAELDRDRALVLRLAFRVTCKDLADATNEEAGIQLPAAWLTTLIETAALLGFKLASADRELATQIQAVLESGDPDMAMFGTASIDDLAAALRASMEDE